MASPARVRRRDERLETIGRTVRTVLGPPLSRAGSGDLGRIAPFDWIEQKLTLKLKQIPLTLPSDATKESYSYVDWESACHFENLAMKDPRALQEALTKINPTVGTFRTAITATDLSFHLEMAEDLDNAIVAALAVEQVLDQKCGGKDAPLLRQFKEALSLIQQLVSQDLHARLPRRSIQRRRNRSPRSRRTRTDYGPAGRFAVVPARTADCRRRISCFAPNPTARRLI